MVEMWLSPLVSVLAASVRAGGNLSWKIWLSEQVLQENNGPTKCDLLHSKITIQVSPLPENNFLATFLTQIGL